MARRKILNAHTITDDQIEALLEEALCVGDPDQVALCQEALDGHEGAAAKCADAINNNLAQE